MSSEFMRIKYNKTMADGLRTLRCPSFSNTLRKHKILGRKKSGRRQNFKV